MPAAVLGVNSGVDGQSEIRQFGDAVAQVAQQFADVVGVAIPPTLPDAVGFQQRLHPVFQGALRVLPDNQIVPVLRIYEQRFQVGFGVQHPVVVVRPAVLVLRFLVLVVGGVVLVGVAGHNDTLPHGVGFHAVGIAAVAPEAFQAAPHQLHRHLASVGGLRRFAGGPAGRLLLGIVRFGRQHQQHINIRLQLVMVAPGAGAEQDSKIRLFPALRQLGYLQGFGVVFRHHLRLRHGRARRSQAILPPRAVFMGRSCSAFPVAAHRSGCARFRTARPAR